MTSRLCSKPSTSGTCQRRVDPTNGCPVHDRGSRPPAVAADDQELLTAHALADPFATADAADTGAEQHDGGGEEWVGLCWEHDAIEGSGFTDEEDAQEWCDVATGYGCSLSPKTRAEAEAYIAEWGPARFARD